MKPFYILISFFFFLFTFTSSSSAQITSNVAEALGKKGTCLGPFCYQDIGKLVSNGLQLGLIVASILVLLYLLWGGIQWITSGGDKNALESAKNRITAALVGTAIVASVWAIYLVIRTFLGLPTDITGIGTGRTNSGSNTQTGTNQTGSPAVNTQGWSCTNPPCDCCNIAAGTNRNSVACCKQVGNLTPGCVQNRYRNSSAECAQSGLYIDWECWKKAYWNLVNSGDVNPKTDPCTP